MEDGNGEEGSNGLEMTNPGGSQAGQQQEILEHGLGSIWVEIHHVLIVFYSRQLSIFWGGKSKSTCLSSLRQPEELDNFREAPMSFWEEMQEKESDLDWIMIKCTLVCI